MSEEKKPEQDNGRLNSIEAKIKELEPRKEDKEVQKELSSLYAEKIKLTQPKQKEPPKDYKIAEIWIKSGTVALDASPGFWMDKLRAIGILHYCRKIVEDYNPADQRKRNLIQRVNMQGFRNFIRGKRR